MRITGLPVAFQFVDARAGQSWGYLDSSGVLCNENFATHRDAGGSSRRCRLPHVDFVEAASPETLRRPIGPPLQLGQEMWKPSDTISSEPAAKMPTEAQGLKPLPPSLYQPQMLTYYIGCTNGITHEISPKLTASNAPPRSSVK